MILFIVRGEGQTIFCRAAERESAKRMCRRIIGGNADRYTVTPVSENGGECVLIHTKGEIHV